MTDTGSLPLSVDDADASTTGGAVVAGLIHLDAPCAALAPASAPRWYSTPFSSPSDLNANEALLGMTLLAAPPPPPLRRKALLVAGAMGASGSAAQSGSATGG